LSSMFTTVDEPRTWINSDRASSGDISPTRSDRPIARPMVCTCSACVSDCGRSEYILQAAIQPLGNREIPAHHLDLWRQTGRIRVADHGAAPRSRCRELTDNLATDIPGAADDEDTIH